MPIASLGGAVVDSEGNRSYEGSGGYIGGLSPEGLNYSYIAGAGKSYHTFTPANSIPGDYPCQDYSCLPIPNPRDYPFPGPGPGPAEPTPTEPGPTTPEPGPVDCADCEPLEIQPWPRTSVLDQIRNLLAGVNRRTQVDSTTPLNVFTPGQPAGGEMNLRTILIFAVLGIGIWFAWKKFA